MDLDSTVCEVCGKAKHGAAYGHTGVLGYHPLVAVRSDTGEVLHSRMRSGSSQRGHERFARELQRQVALGLQAPCAWAAAYPRTLLLEMFDALQHLSPGGVVWVGVLYQWPRDVTPR